MLSASFRRARAAIAAAILLAAAACDAPVRAPQLTASAAAPAAEGSASAAPIAAPAPSDAGGWQSFDAVPPGALFRLGTRAYTGQGELAVSPSGTLATDHHALGLIEIRADGLFRKVPVECRLNAVRYDGEVLHALCDKKLIRWDGATVTSTPTGCDASGDGDGFSPRGERFVCTAHVDKTYAVQLYDAASAKLLWAAGNATEPRAMAVSDAGVVFASDEDSALVALAEGKLLWKLSGDLEAPVLVPGRDELVVWNETDSRFDVLGVKDGKRVRRTPKASHSLRGPIAMLPDGASWIAIAEDSPSTLKRWDAKDGRELASWPADPYAAGAAVSSNGLFAAAHGDRILRVDLTTGKASPKIGYPSSEPASVSSSRAGDRIVVIHRDEELRVFDAKSGKELGHGKAPDAISRDVPVAYSPDGASMVLANAYGDLRILDAGTLREKCRSEEVGATWLYWSGKHIIAVYLGNVADDEQYQGGAVMVLDANCKLESARPHEGYITVAGDDGQSLDLLFEAYEAPPWGEKIKVPAASKTTRAMRLSHATGTITAAPASVLKKALAERAAAEKEAEDGSEVERVTSDDRATVATAVVDDERKRTVTCRDAKTNEVHALHELPRTAWWGLSVASDGSWFAVPDGPTVLVYPCRKAAAAPTR